ncbi:unnamed protein product [Brassicogethes aeneus]|uniref:Zinc finger PHD-type domain-containing protein n=1 Tax=Brassicogethes aeneus TaxID=1431903 RepID=A0A9P0FFF8_BRAAE|nr:unnamed protein product [Brassicogethes aeneus]
MPTIQCSCGCAAFEEEHKIVICCVCNKPTKYTCADLTASEVRKTKTKVGLSWSCTICNQMGNDINSLKAIIISLKNDILELKNRDSPIVNNFGFEDIIQEINEREKRKSNVIIYNIPECLASSSSDRSKEDKLVVDKALQYVLSLHSETEKD